MFRASRLAILLLAAIMVSSVPAPLAQLPGVDVDVDTGIIDEVSVENGTVGINGTVGANVSADPELNATAPHVGSKARFTFDLPLYADDSFRFLNANGSARDTVLIRVHWQDVTGRDQPFPASSGQRAVLEADNGHRILTPPVLRFEAGDTVAVFELHYAQLLQGAQTSWYLTARAPGDDVSALGTTASIGHEYTRDGNAVAISIGDLDLDGRPNDIDNCRDVVNPDQANLDGDMHGDACDEDIDDDGASNEAEHIAQSDPRDPRSTPDDPDADGYNNTQEAEAGSDPYDAASTPDDPDADGYNNTQEAEAGSDPRWAASTPHDIDGDGYPNEEDLCPELADDQSDGDGDGIGDACDERLQDGPTGDADDDGTQNQHDNCPRHANPDQADLDRDGRGDSCDSDIDGDGYPRGTDAFPYDSTEWSDNDNDGTGDNADQDDDNDGLSDDAEAEIGTSPWHADTDGDLIDDLGEIREGSDPREPYDPPYVATSVIAEATSEGALIRWEGSGDVRIDHYIVWHRSPLRVVGIVPAQGAGAYEVLDPMPGTSDHMYSVQSVLHGQDDRFVWLASQNAMVFGSDLVQAQAGPDDEVGAAPVEVSAPGENVEAPTSDKESPGPGFAIVVLMLMWLARRR